MSAAKAPWPSWRRDIRRMERLLDELPGYLDDLPMEAREEIVARLLRLEPRIDEFCAALKEPA